MHIHARARALHKIELYGIMQSPEFLIDLRPRDSAVLSAQSTQRIFPDLTFQSPLFIFTKKT